MGRPQLIFNQVNLGDSFQCNFLLLYQRSPQETDTIHIPHIFVVVFEEGRGEGISEIKCFLPICITDVFVFPLYVQKEKSSYK